MNNDFIQIDNLKVYAYHGVFEEETKNGQNFFLSAKLYSNLNTAGKSDNLDDSTNYGEVMNLMHTLMTKRTFLLIEAAANYVATELLKKFTSISKIELKLSKPDAPVCLPFEDVSVNITKCRHTAYIALGSNIGNKKEHLDFALSKINENPMCNVNIVSDYIETEPYGYLNQDNFLNSVAKIDTIYEPYELLDFLHEIENAAGRTREIHWGPRTLDLDILFFDDIITSDMDLVIPHPEIEKRDFVLTPLKQISPYLVHPLLNKRIIDITPQ